MNEYDSELISGLLKSDGFVLAYSADSADIVLVNTCAVRELAAEKAYSYLGTLLKAGRKKGRVVVMCGCVAEQDGKEALKRMVGIDLVVGPGKIRNISSVIKEFLKKKVRKDVTGEGLVEWEKDASIDRKSGEKAWVTVSKGCNSFCSYCIVPYARGREESRPADDILKTVTGLVKKGYNEINLIGQNVNIYGKDRKGLPDFSQLLASVDSIPGDFRVTFMTSHPKDIPEKLIQAVAGSKKVLRSFHLPLQSGSDRILLQMNRQYDTAHYLEIVKLVRELIHPVSLTTDIIVGFPGETEADFEATMDVFWKAAFDSAYLFKYSPRKGTVAFKLGDTVEKKTKEKRLAKLMDLQRKTGLASNLPLEGSIQRVLVDPENSSDGKYCGKTITGKQVFFKGQIELSGFLEVKVTAAGPFSLKGELVK